MADVLPPPTRPPPTPRTNADFRALLETPRANRGGETPSRGQQKPAAQKKRPPRPKPKATETETADDEPRYRDRAEERRKGLNPDYERTAMSGLPTDEALNPTMSVEETKYLGGDLEHTHLVKGLDYALLQKVKVEQTDKQKEEAQDSKLKGQKVKAKQDIKFVTPDGQAVYNALFKPFRAPASEMFLPMRTAFVYDLEEQDSNTDVPTTLRRSKEDCPPPVPVMSGHVDSAVLERMAKIMSYMRVSAGKPSKKPKKKDKLAALHGMAGAPGANFPIVHGSHHIMPKAAANGNSMPPPAARVKASDDDIFGDAGTDYVCELPKSRSAASDQAASKDGSYFGSNIDKMDDLPPLPQADKAPGEVDMDVDDSIPPPPPPPPGGVPPPPPPPSDSIAGPAPPPDGYDYSQAYSSFGSQGPDSNYEAYVASNVQYQASTDPEYQALLSQRQQLQDPDAQAAMGSMTKEQKDAGLASVYKRDDGKKRKETDARMREAAFVPDAYGECYPGYHELGTAVVDDDEADFTAMDSKEKGRSRYDFDTEEQWQDYKSVKEANPKAAFQFGVKMTEGRKAHKDLGKNRDQKLSNQLGKIKNILEKDGGDYNKAFSGAPSQTGGETPGASKRRRI
ncbi:hypothetical protein ABBQ32_013660 [Trebouxia sp. C0010 RCD-2024]